jgi:hypothetical protein
MNKKQTVFPAKHAKKGGNAGLFPIGQNRVRVWDRPDDEAQ